MEALIALAETLAQDRRLADALTHAQEATALAVDRGYRMLAGRALTVTAAVQLAAGRTDDALESVTAALVRHRETGHRFGEAQALALLGQLTTDGAQADPARSCRT